jgi:hypothetical protein
MKAVKAPKKAKGMIDDIRNKFEKIKRSGQTTVDKAVSTIVNLPEQVKSEVQDKVLSPILNKVEDIKKTAVAVVSGPTDLSKSVRDILKKHGSKTIVKASIVRTPVSSVVKEALNVVSLGEFKRKLKQQPYDDIFHLFMLMTLSDGTTVSLEKNSIITMRVNPSRKGESREASPPEGLTLDSLMENTKRKMGAKFIPYSAKSANCQNFILNVLRANKMATPELETFVKQDTDALFEGDSGFLRKFSNTVTDLGAKIATVQEGGAVTSPKKANAWIQHCKDEASRRGISYREAMRSAETKETYKK